MFSIFKKSPSDELRTAIKNLVKDINLNGGAISFCGNFAELVVNDDLFKTLGIFNESKLPHPKSQLMLASIMLLSDIKNPPDFLDKDNLEYMRAISKATFVYSNCAVSDAELSELLLMPSSDALTTIRNKKIKYEEAWNDWLTSDVDIEKLMYSVLS